MAGTEAGLFAGRKVGDRWTWQRDHKVGSMPVHAVRQEPDGSLWLGTERNGAARIDSRTGKVDWFREAQGLAAVSPYALALDRSGRVWAATEKGLFVAELSTKRFRRVEEVPAVSCWAVVEGPDGTILVGTSTGLFRLSGNRWRRISTTDGLRHDVVLSIAATATGEIWVGYWLSGSLTRILVDGKRLSMTPLWRRSRPAGRHDLLPRVRCWRPALVGIRSGRARLGRHAMASSTIATTA